MGFGHACTRTDDPRSLMLRRSPSGSVVRRRSSPSRSSARIVELLDELKPGRRLYPNVEFYAGVVMDQCGMPRSMFTPTFATAGSSAGAPTSSRAGRPDAPIRSALPRGTSGRRHRSRYRRRERRACPRRESGAVPGGAVRRRSSASRSPARPTRCPACSRSTNWRPHHRGGHTLRGRRHRPWARRRSTRRSPSRRHRLPQRGVPAADRLGAPRPWDPIAGDLRGGRRLDPPPHQLRAAPRRRRQGLGLGRPTPDRRGRRRSGGWLDRRAAGGRPSSPAGGCAACSARRMRGRAHPQARPWPPNRCWP